MLCGIITDAPANFVTAARINDNWLNLVKPEPPGQRHDAAGNPGPFARGLGVYHERQENAFADLSYEEMEEAGIPATDTECWVLAGRMGKLRGVSPRVP